MPVLISYLLQASISPFSAYWLPLPYVLSLGAHCPVHNSPFPSHNASVRVSDTLVNATVVYAVHPWCRPATADVAGVNQRKGYRKGANPRVCPKVRTPPCVYRPHYSRYF